MRLYTVQDAPKVGILDFERPPHQRAGQESPQPSEGVLLVDTPEQEPVLLDQILDGVGHVSQVWQLFDSAHEGSDIVHVLWLG